MLLESISSTFSIDYGGREGTLLLNFRPTMNFLDSDEPSRERITDDSIYMYPRPDSVK